MGNASDTKEQLRSLCFRSKTAAQWLGFVAVALLIIGGGRQDAAADLVVNVWEPSPGMTQVQWGDGAGGAGVLNVSGWTTSAPIASSVAQWQGGIFNTLDNIRFLKNPWVYANRTNGLGTPSLFNVFVPPVSGWGAISGDSFGIYNSGTNSDPDWVYATDFSSISGSVSRTGTVTDLGLTAGTVSLAGSGPDRSITFVLDAPTSAVPEPTTTLALFGLVTSAFFRRRRRLLV